MGDNSLGPYKYQPVRGRDTQYDTTMYTPLVCLLAIVAGATCFIQLPNPVNIKPSLPDVPSIIKEKLPILGSPESSESSERSDVPSEILDGIAKLSTSSDRTVQKFIKSIKEWIHHLRPNKPLRCPILSRPNHRPTSPSGPNHRPTSPSEPNHRPTSPSEPNHRPTSPSESNHRPTSPSGPSSSSPTPSTSNRPSSTPGPSTTSRPGRPSTTRRPTTTSRPGRPSTTRRPATTSSPQPSTTRGNRNVRDLNDVVSDVIDGSSFKSLLDSNPLSDMLTALSDVDFSKVLEPVPEIQVQNLTKMPLLPGLKQSIEMARNLTVTALGGTSDIVATIQTAVEDAIRSFDPVNALASVLQTILKVFYNVAKKEPLHAFGMAVLADGVRIIGNIVRNVLDSVSNNLAD